MFKHYLLTAFRNLKRSKLSSLIGIAGLALGLACFIVALGAVTYFTNNDRQLPNSDRVLVVTTRFNFASLALDTGYRPGSSWIVLDQFRADFPTVKATRARNVRQLLVYAGDRTTFLSAGAATANFLDVVELPLSYSDPSPLSVAQGVVLSERAALNLFGTTAVLGKTLSLQRAFDVTVTGVMREIAQPSHIGPSKSHTMTFDILLSEDTYIAFESAVSGQPPPPRIASQSWGYQGNQTYIQLPKDGSLTARDLQTYFDSFSTRYKPARLTQQDFLFKLVPLRELRLAALDNELFRGNDLTLSMVILLAAFLVLGVASLNYANLSIAESLARQRDLGLRRALGASRRQILLQAIVESGMRLSCALLLGTAILISIVAFRPIENAASIVLTAVASSTFWCALAGVLVALNLLLSSYCAIVQLRATPIRSLQDSAARSGSGFGFRFLMSLQFAVAALFLIGLSVSRQQNETLRDIALHPDEDPVVAIEFPWQSAKVDYEVVRSELLNHSSIKTVSVYPRTGPWETGAAVMTFNKTPASPTMTTVISMVQQDFEKVLSLTVLAGRSYSKEQGDREWGAAMPTVTSAFEHRAVVDRTFARAMGFSTPQDAVGKLIYQPNTRTGAENPITIIGVVEDKPYRLEVAKNTVGSLYVLMPGRNGNLVARIDKNNVVAALATIDSIWKKFAPYAPVKRKFFDEYFEERFQTFARVNQVLTFTAAIGLAICASGLFGIALFIANRRSREIGIRKTLGARVDQIVSMLLRDFSMPILIANLLAWPFAYLAVGKYLERFVERVPLTPLPFVLSLAVTLIVAWLAVGGHAWRAARLKPADVLRHE